MRVLNLFVHFAVIIAAIFLLSNCGQKPPAQIAATPRVYTSAEVRAEFPRAYCGDTAYSQIDSQTLAAYYTDFRQQLFNEGVVNWDERFDCNHFASFYVDLAQVRFYLSHFHSWTKAQTLAIGTFWYRPDHSATGHAIVAALTERGVVFIEPQTGGEVALSAAERQSAFLVQF